jgi:hypothetical protein
LFQKRTTRSKLDIYVFITSLVILDCISLGTPVFSTNKTDRRDITEILLKVALNIITLTLKNAIWKSDPL